MINKDCTTENLRQNLRNIKRREWVNFAVLCLKINEILCSNWQMEKCLLINSLISISYFIFYISYICIKLILCLTQFKYSLGTKHNRIHPPPVTQSSLIHLSTRTLSSQTVRQTRQTTRLGVSPFSSYEVLIISLTFSWVILNCVGCVWNFILVFYSKWLMKPPLEFVCGRFIDWASRASIACADPKNFVYNFHI